MKTLSYVSWKALARIHLFLLRWLARSQSSKAICKETFLAFSCFWGLFSCSSRKYDRRIRLQSRPLIYRRLFRVCQTLSRYIFELIHLGHWTNTITSLNMPVRASNHPGGTETSVVLLWSTNQPTGHACSVWYAIPLLACHGQDQFVAYE